ncbi:hypothetical protein CVT24_012723 [Panaeolus cyanescens]|uniref:F-box domain-containing protein n=1 Tax=Panaeolus cyanescens TaxID=181874 RepID=A0A409YJQ5_9AGAR|nr:hypothetical protein CVT24_012723 [Panaeolus cyanescens]
MYVAGASEPVFPRELERMIFEMAFDPKAPDSNWRLVSVAKRVHTWLRPLIYSTFCLCVTSHSKAFPNIQTRPDFIDIVEICSFARHLVVDLKYMTTQSAVSDILDKCPNLTSLSCGDDILVHLIWPSVSKLTKLQQLALGDINHFSSAQLLSAPFSSRLTHLELLDLKCKNDSNSNRKLEFLTSLTNLTHFALHISDSNDGYPELDYKHLGRVLLECPNIRVFILCSAFEDIPEDARDLHATECRMVLINVSLCNMYYWAREKEGGHDTWAYAEQVVLLRNAGHFILNDEVRFTEEELIAGDFIGREFPWDEHLTEEGMELATLQLFKSAPSELERMYVTTVSKPVLPRELERMIFEMAFNNEALQTNWNLVLVAKRVRTWLRPLIYATFILSTNRKVFPNMHTGTCPAFINTEEIYHFAHHLIANNSSTITPDALSELLDKCPNLTNLACWGDIIPQLIWPSLSKLTHLQRLSLANVDHLSFTQLVSAAFSSRLTHLELMRPEKDCQPEFLTSLSSLTHFAIYFPWVGPEIDYERLGAVIAACPSVRVFVLCSSYEDIAAGAQDLYAAERRMVLVDKSLSDLDHWLCGARGGNDSWAYAEQVVMMRKAGYFTPEKADPGSERIPYNNISYIGDFIRLGFPWRDLLTDEGMVWLKSSILKELL